MWKEATAAMTALVYSILHTRIYREYVHVYWPRVRRYTRKLTKTVLHKDMDPDPHLVFGLDADPQKTDADPKHCRRVLSWKTGVKNLKPGTFKGTVYEKQLPGSVWTEQNNILEVDRPNWRFETKWKLANRWKSRRRRTGRIKDFKKFT